MTHAKKYILFLLLLTTGCKSTNDENNDPPLGEKGIELKSYVAVYFELQDIELTVKKNIIEIYEKIDQKISYTCFDTDPEKLLRYDQYCERYNDYGYDSIVAYPSSHGQYPNKYFSDIFTGVDIISDKDFDSEHPAGTSLSDICTFYTLSPLEYIKSRYTDFDWENYVNFTEFKELFPNLITQRHNYITAGRGSIYPIKAKANDLTEDDLTLLGRGLDQGYFNDPFAVIKFDAVPETTGTHNITITITNTEERIFSDTVTFEFE
ncbi:MAG: hypothetical protein LIO79_05120 [Rikenellaceae bacterium]|nr:hypothetical protein [Rikenellaceae bacterium]